MDFQTKDTSDFWSAPLYHFYPQLDRAHIDTLPPEGQKEYIGQILRQVYNEQKGAIDNKVLCCIPPIGKTAKDKLQRHCRMLLTWIAALFSTI